MVISLPELRSISALNVNTASLPSATENPSVVTEIAGTSLSLTITVAEELFGSN